MKATEIALINFLVDDCDRHWDRMILWVEQMIMNDPSFADRQVKYRFMEETIGESWHANDCALCGRFYTKRDDPEDCTDCPYKKAYGYCGSYMPHHKNAWRAVANQGIWEYWLKYAREVHEQVKSLRIKVEES